MSLLRLDAVQKVFGGLHALRKVSFSVEKGQIFGLIGPNGAGKTTLFNVITGVYQPDAGHVYFDGADVSGLALLTRAHELLDVLGLRGHASDLAGSLPYGSQRRLEIARALMLAPKLLLLDEPAAGMNSNEARDLERQIRFLRDELGVTVVLVEHNMAVVMSVCEQIHVVDHGETIAEGPPAVVREHPRVLAAYLGQEVEDAPGSEATA
jgi:branched-chain amino acid transport system ATP-binding protein